ncbi:MAG TPA: hypothetical protein VM223_13425, partial [Planctomycetota bacterium]|nr:hypothetical protein [Planctomycetota bacterium]
MAKHNEIILVTQMFTALGIIRLVMYLQLVCPTAQLTVVISEKHPRSYSVPMITFEVFRVGQ